MQKKLTVALILALILTAFATAAVFANCGKAGCTAKAADQKGGCMHGKDDKACCAHQKDMMASMEALEKDPVVKSSSNRIFNRAALNAIQNGGLQCQGQGQDVRVLAPIAFTIN